MGAGSKMAPRNPGSSPNKVFLNPPLFEFQRLYEILAIVKFCDKSSFGLQDIFAEV